jgi:arylsulfatase B
VPVAVPRAHAHASRFRPPPRHAPSLPPSQRGGKASNLEGGVRVNGFASGGLIPPARRGAVEHGLVAIEDWYTTFCSLAGVDPTDEEAAAAGLPPVEGLDMWPLISGANATSPRTHVILGSSNGPNIMENGRTIVTGVIRADGWKLLVGDIGGAFWQGPTYPNASGYPSATLHCGDGCLFNVFTDPSETADVAAAHPDIVADLRKILVAANETVYSPDRGGDDGAACAATASKWGGFYGPFIGV